MQGFWFSFPAIWLTIRFGLLSVRTEEWLWTICDFFGESVHPWCGSCMQAAV